jgi:microcystin-dependent protein
MNIDLAMLMIFAGNFAPQGFATCDGQIISISQNTALFSLLGTNYGGNGQSTFALPDLRGRVPIHWGQGPGLSNYSIAEVGGTEVVTLISNQIPAHNHGLLAYAGGPTTASPNGAYLASGPLTGSGPNASLLNTYATNQPNITLGSASIQPAGGNQPHPNLQPYLAMTFVIALQGIYPARN